MITVFSSAGRVQRLPRPWPTMAGSVVVHAAAVGALVGLASATAAVITPEPDAPLRFVQVVPPPPMKPPVRLPPLTRERVKLVETPPPALEPPPIPERVEARAEPAPPDPEPVVPPPIERPQPRAAPTVSVGGFDAAPSARTTEVARMTQPAGFDTAAARTTQSRAATAVLGGFDQGARSVAGSPRGTVVADAGFGTGAVAGSGRGDRAGAVVSGGFDSGTGGGGTGAKPSGPIKTADFDAPAAQAAPKPVVRQAPKEVPPEILSKPTPVYTDEARAGRIEGEVVLEVEFSATGAVRVVRVVRGLGHGLDEAAIRAATAIRFKPAQRDGEPVDFRTTLNIVFRLA